VGENYPSPQTLNRYSYCINNPLKYNDPTGHFNTATDDGGWHAGTPAKMVEYPPIQSGGVGTGFNSIYDSQFSPNMPMENTYTGDQFVMGIEVVDKVDAVAAIGLAVPMGGLATAAGVSTIAGASAMAAEAGLAGLAGTVIVGGAGVIMALTGVGLVVGASVVIYFLFFY